MLWALTTLLYACADEQKETVQAPPPMAVDYLVASGSEMANEINIPGTILPFEYVDLYAEIDGRIASIHFTEGQNVSKGQLLFKLDTDILEAQLKQVISDLDFAKKDEQRKKALLEAKSISLEDYELSQSKKMNLEAQAEVLRVQIQKGRVVAPFSGKVGLREVSEGAFVSPSTKLTNLAQSDRVKIEFSIGERYAQSVKIGTEISFNFASDSTMHMAKIYATSPTIDPQTRMLTVRAEVKTKALAIPGTFIEINYSLGIDAKSIMVPASALVPVLNGQKIWIIENGLAKSVMIQPGLRNKKEVQIIGDIELGDTIVLSGLLGIREGMPVTIKK